MHVNLDYMISLHPQKAILHTFSGQIQLFLGKMQETKPKNLHHHKAGSVAGLLSLRLKVHHLQKMVQYFLQHGGPQIYTISCKAACMNLFTII